MGPEPRRPLEYVRIVVTRASEQAGVLAGALRGLGAQVEELAAVEILTAPDYGPLDAALSVLGDYDWLIFTSVNGVRFVEQRLGRMGRALMDFRGRVAVIGPATRQAVESLGLPVNLTPAEYVAESLLQAFAAVDLRGRRILLPRAALARDVLPSGLAAAGARVDVVEAYRVEAPPGLAREARRLFSSEPRPDWITFTSSSTVRNLIEAAGAPALGGVRIASIGPITSSTVRRYGLPVSAEAAVHDIGGLVEALVAAHRR